MASGGPVGNRLTQLRENTEQITRAMSSLFTTQKAGGGKQENAMETESAIRIFLQPRQLGLIIPMVFPLASRARPSASASGGFLYSGHLF